MTEEERRNAALEHFDQLYANIQDIVEEQRQTIRAQQREIIQRDEVLRQARDWLDAHGRMVGGYSDLLIAIYEIVGHDD